MTGKRVVLTTAGSNDEARSIAGALVERRLAACVNIVGPIVSLYRWKGKVENSQEWLLIAKTTADLVDALAAAIKELHSYDLPECIALPVEQGSTEYLDWIGESVTAASE